MSAAQNSTSPAAMETDEVPIEVENDKLEIISGSHNDHTSMTFSLKDEDHTLGNALRYMIMKNPEVDYCGYSIPHPSEAKMNIRVQTTDRTSAIEVMDKGLQDLIDLCTVVVDAFKAEVSNGDFEYDEDAVWP
ncbi:DNA-directed RNA polymerase III subunit C19 [Jimgerdemannia flammicorona]|uniref:DNA-directed RNA polymerases I and III subunit RPAC2 n=2 Tax=Jimgerdemannia flammicorona TaxID=994334 RepID=A0A433QCZ6_9FUNG|nr:DNA-directed RNA polymerase III subunit C19 [Jimgerdemannia flammicorona]